MHENMQQFTEKFRVDELKVFENDTWIWSVRPLQCTLGAGILSTKKYTEQFSAVPTDGGADLVRIARVIERTLQRAFGYEKVNYLMLMMIDLNVHYHVLPRYSGEITFAGVAWVDQGWPALPVLKGGETSDPVLVAIRDELRKNLA